MSFSPQDQLTTANQYRSDYVHILMHILRAKRSMRLSFYAPRRVLMLPRVSVRLVEFWQSPQDSDVTVNH